MIEYNGYYIEYMNSPPMYGIKNKGQGPVPKALKGMFTTTETAKRFIDTYLATKKGSTNGKAKSTSTG